MNDDNLLRKFGRKTYSEASALEALGRSTLDLNRFAGNKLLQGAGEIAKGFRQGPGGNQPTLTPRPRSTALSGAAGKIINPAEAVSPDILGTAEQQGLGAPNQNLQDRLNRQRLNDRNLGEIPGQNLLNQAELFPNQPRGEQVTGGLGQDPLANVLNQGQLFPEVGQQDPTKPAPPPETALDRAPKGLVGETLQPAGLPGDLEQLTSFERNLLPNNREEIAFTDRSGRGTISGESGFRERMKQRSQQDLIDRYGVDAQGKPVVPLPSRGSLSVVDFSAGRQATQENIGRLDKQLAEIERQNLIKNANAQVSTNQTIGSFANAVSRRNFAKKRLTALDQNTATATQNALAQSATAKQKRLDRQAKTTDERFKLSANAEQDALTRQHTSGENQLTRDADTKAASLTRQTDKSEFLNEPVVIESTEMVKGFPVTKKNTFFRRFDPDLKRMVLFNPETGERRPI